MYRSRALWRRIAVTGVAALALGGLAGCGSSSSSGSGSSGEKVSTADATSVIKNATKDIKSAHIVSEIKGSVSGQSLDSHKEADIQVSPLAMRTVGTGALGSESRYVDGKMYVKSPAGWTQLPQASVTKALAGSGNPLGMLDKFSAAMSDAKKLGDDHYQVTLDAAKVGTALGLPGSGAGGDVTEDVYLDGDGRLSRATVKMADLTVDLTLSKIGEPVDVQAPPADQVEQMSGLG